MILSSNQKHLKSHKKRRKQVTMTIDVYSPFPNQCGQLWFERRLSQDSGLHRLSLLSISSHPSPQIAKVDPKHATTERGVYINII